MIDLQEIQETVILVAVSLDSREETAMHHLDELEELVETAGAKAVGRVIQNREQFDPATYVGKGKVDEIRSLLYITKATGIVCDDELSPAQISNLSQILDSKVMDRTMVILDIFAQRASSAEGKVQVELAQQRYHLTHLMGLGTSLSRLGGGIGTRGPGEKKLEMDRRLIRSRITQLKRELNDIQRHRQITRENRQRSQTCKVAIVGYTNAGKSTLLNRLTDAGVLEENQLFATLDPTTRSLRLDHGQEVLLTDTVGFIDKLPHHLIDAFKSTLEEAKFADYIIHVVDASDPQMNNHMHVVYETLEQLDVKNKKIITVFNKMDRVQGECHFHDPRAVLNVRAAVGVGRGLEEVRACLEELLREDRRKLDCLLPYSKAGEAALIRKYGELLLEEYTGEGVHVVAYVPGEIYGRIMGGEKE